MGLYSTSSRYGVGAQVFHWLTIVLVLAAYTLSKGDGYSLYSAAADGIRRIHETLGMFVFIVVVLRPLWRLIDRAHATETRRSYPPRSCSRNSRQTSTLSSVSTRAKHIGSNSLL